MLTETLNRACTAHLILDFTLCALSNRQPYAMIRIFAHLGIIGPISANHILSIKAWGCGVSSGPHSKRTTQTGGGMIVSGWGPQVRRVLRRR